MSSIAKDSTLKTIFLKLPPDNIASMQFLLESYEGIGILRTLDAEKGEVVVLSLESVAQTLEQLINSVLADFGARIIPPPSSLKGDWLLAEHCSELESLMPR